MQLAKCWKPRVSAGTRSLSVGPFLGCTPVSSDNPAGAANQQERPGFEQVGRRLRREAHLLIKLVFWNPQRPYASHLISTGEAKIWSKPYGDIRNNLSEIPCRVSHNLPRTEVTP